jgi:hypothetical protein
MKAIRLARIAIRRTAATLEASREPIARGAKRAGADVRRTLSRIRLRYVLVVAGSFAVLLVLIVG